jgi:hypothetical protein
MLVKFALTESVLTKELVYLKNIKTASPMCDMKGMDGWMLKAVGSTLFRPYTFRTCAKGMTKKSFQMALS